MAIPPGILQESTRNKNHQEFTLQWTLAGGKFLVIPPGFLVFLPGMVGFLEDSSRNRWGSVKTSACPPKVILQVLHMSKTFEGVNSLQGIYYHPSVGYSECCDSRIASAQIILVFKCW
jgi:hypothetical protein